MQAFTQITSSIIPLDMDNVDTDMIIPAQFLTKVDKEGYGEHLFQRLKEQDSGFVFNDPQYQAAEILVTKANFGCGSSREHAVWALQQAGIKVVLAESYSDIFYNNATKNGLLTVCLPQEIISKFMKSTIKLTIDLAGQTIHNEIVDFDFDPFRKECFLKGQDDLDYLLEATR
jgi:3-isopropylmalate/(R)-2-methylmalate dehydratase small subunit